MSTTEHILIDLQRQIESTLAAVRREGRAADSAVAGGESHPSDVATGSVVLPNMQPPPALPRPEEMATRDLQIARELLHLQRTLSRQTFRGAESARRLVRRLIRRAELNAREIRTLSGAPSTDSGTPAGQSGQLVALFKRLSEQLAELQAIGRTLGSLPGAGDTAHGNTPR